MSVLRNRNIRGCGLFLLCMVITINSCSWNKAEPSAEYEPGEAWLQDVRSEIDTAIMNAYKQEQLFAIVDRFEQELDGLDQVVQAHYRKLITVDKNIGATPGDFRKVFDEFYQERLRFRARFLDLRFEMVALVTAEEWDKLTTLSKKDALFLNWQRMPLQN